MDSSFVRHAGAVVLLAIACCAAQWGGSGGVHAATGGSRVCGSLSRSAVWTRSGSPYSIDCNLRLPAGRTLTIRPGVTVLAETGVTFEVQGRLIAMGTASHPITFDCAPGCHMWSGLRFTPRADSRSSMGHTVIAHASLALSDPHFTIGELTFKQDRDGVKINPAGYANDVTPSLIESSTFSHISGVAIDLGSISSSTVAVTGVTVSDSGIGVLVHGTSPQVSSSTFTRNKIGLQIAGAGSDRTRVLSNSIVANRIGVVIEAEPDMLISANNIYGNHRFSVKVTESSDVLLAAPNNYWGAGIAGPGIPATMNACGFDPYVLAPCVIFKPYLTSPSSTAPTVPGH